MKSKPQPTDSSVDQPAAAQGLDPKSKSAPETTGSLQGHAHRSALVPALALVVFNLGLAFVGYKVLARAWKTAHIPLATATVTPKTQAVTTSSTSLSDSIQPVATYTSKQFKLAFSYRSDWEVTENEYGVTIDSPIFSYSKQASGDNSQKLPQKVRGIIKLIISKDGQNTTGEMAIKSSDLIQHAGPLNGRKSSYLSYLGQDGSFKNLTFTGDTKLAKGDQVTFYDLNKNQLNPMFSSPISMVGGYWDIDAPRQAISFDDILIANFDKTETFNQAIDVIKSLHSS